MICKHCNIQNPDDALFCRKCGKGLIEEKNNFPVFLIAFVILGMIIVFFSVTKNCSNPAPISAPLVDSTVVAVDTMAAADTAAVESQSSGESDNQFGDNLDLDYIQSLEGKYPSKVKLFENISFVNRLRSSIEKKVYSSIENCDIEYPIEISDGYLIINGCQAHNCSTTNFIILLELNTNILYVGYRDGENLNKYSDKSLYCKKLDDWENNVNN